MKRNREERGITLPQIAAVTRIRATHFANMEEGNLAELPAPVYLRGFLIEYARRTLLPDPELFATRYLAWVAQQPQYKG